MQLRLTDLNGDVLALVCERIVRAGEAFWFASTCRAARAATQRACNQLRLPLCTRAATAFTSVERLEMAMGLKPLRALVHANMNATNASTSRPASLHRKYVWSPAGERVLAAGATAKVLDYAWAGWRTSYEVRNPGCFLVAASAAGRADLLVEMDRHNVEIAHARLGSGLCNRLDGALICGSHMDIQWIEDGILVPALRSGNTAAIRWYYERSERRSREIPSVATCFRAALDPKYLPAQAGSCPLQRLSRAAALGRDPIAALNFLQTWMWPRFGSRAPSRAGAAAVKIAAAVLLSSLGSNQSETAQAWQWLEGFAPQGAHSMLEILSAEGNVHTGPLVRRIWEVRHVDVYRWMQDRFGPQQWLHQLALTNLNNHPGDMRLAFAHLNLVAIKWRRTEQEKYDPEASWQLDRELCTLALADALVWSLSEFHTVPVSWLGLTLTMAAQEDRLKALVGEHVEALLEHDPGALVDAVCDAASRAVGEFGGDGPRALVMEYMSESCARPLLLAGSGCTHAMQLQLRAAALEPRQRGEGSVAGC